MGFLRGKLASKPPGIKWSSPPMDTRNLRGVGTRRFEILDFGCGLEAKVDIGVAQLRGDDSTLNEIGPTHYKVKGNDPA
ncbi:hypothetical protein EVAR_52053_1 [Eumeta japonica]|uniref:Uncharacterized protein n=1 Tax=Eumeta variegata TaxID=151549 RepID=A0A4C1Z7F7_EUMVA|nr:hypothetical protein EVAR_52053_1 [Eumeta japonica]